MTRACQGYCPGGCPCCVVYGPPPIDFEASARRAREAVEEALKDPEVAREFRSLSGRMQLGVGLFNLLAPLTGEEPIPVREP